MNRKSFINDSRTDFEISCFLSVLSEWTPYERKRKDQNRDGEMKRRISRGQLDEKNRK